MQNTIGMIRRAAVLALGAGAFAAALVASQPAKADGNALAFWQGHAAKEAPAKVKTRRGFVKPRGEAVAGRSSFRTPAFVRGRLVCAINANRWLAANGIRGWGTARALDALSWGRASGPRPGAVHVTYRGGRGNGHTKIVLHHDGERWVCLNPSSSRQRWVEAPCGPAAAYRVA